MTAPLTILGSTSILRHLTAASRELQLTFRDHNENKPECRCTCSSGPRVCDMIGWHLRTDQCPCSPAREAKFNCQNRTTPSLYLQLTPLSSSLFCSYQEIIFPHSPILVLAFQCFLQGIVRFRSENTTIQPDNCRKRNAARRINWNSFDFA